MFNNFSTQLPDNDYTRRNIPLIREAAEEYLKSTAKTLPYSRFKLFFETGSRVEYEADYIEHRRRLNVFCVMSLYEADEKWILALEDAVWAVCDEFTWSLPAHLEKTEFSDYYHSLDLFSCETGFALSEIWYLLKDRLSDMVKERIVYDVRRRVIDYYLSSEKSWSKNNWSAVCAGSIGCCIMYLGTERELMSVTDRLQSSMKDFLDSYYDDGCCLEGSLYWEYGFEYFCYFAHMLKQYTNGKYDYFKDEKVHKMALFRQRACIFKNMVVPFADAPHYCNYKPGFIHFLAGQYNDVTVIGREYESMFDDDTRHRFAGFIRNFYWYNEELKREDKPENYYFPQAQWYIKYMGKTAVAAKGGNNAEPHNHNDVGSYAVVMGSQTMAGDMGGPFSYPGDYFSGNAYKYPIKNSFGHPVPFINGQCQVSGKKAQGVVLKKELTGGTDIFQIDYTSAYATAVPELEKLIRTFTYNRAGEGTFVIEDRFEAVSGISFETAITTRADWKMIGNNRLELVLGGEKMTVDIEAPGVVEFDSETVEVNSPAYTRIGIRLKKPLQSGSVRLIMYPSRP